MNIYIFSYGSLRNAQSRAITLPGEHLLIDTCLHGYVRKFNAPVNRYLYLNIVPKKGSVVKGTLIGISENELVRIKLREPGYACIDVSSQFENFSKSNIFTFIAPNKTYPDLKIPRSYITTCTSFMSEKEKELWLKETVIENEIEEDSDTPVYENVG